ncbi:MAG: OB-fold domain-containing protein [Deltaproteobacteria bacterium]|nr:OB-fold domain-containing protein [Deltaproteobacteria bacterium]
MATPEREIRKPLPEITPVTQPFWEAAAKGKLVMQRCSACRSWIWCPRPACVECGSENLRWTPLSGHGKVFAFTVIREVVGRALRGFARDIPYVTAWIDLDEGPRFCSNVVECSADQVAIGMDVEVVFEEARQGVFLPKFRPLSGSHPE